MHASLLHTLAALITSLVLSSPRIVLPQDEQETDPPVTQDVLAELEDYTPCGFVSEVDDPRPLKRELADLMVQYRTLGQAKDILSKLDQIWLQASAEDAFSGQSSLLAQIAVARAELLLDQGETKEALRAVTQLLPDGKDPRWKDALGLMPARKELLEQLRIGEQDPHLQVVRAKILQQLELPAAAALLREDSLQAVIDDAIAGEDWYMIGQIGSRAAPHLLEAILRAPDDFQQNFNQDPVNHLTALAEQKAAVELLAHIDAGGYLWKRRILRAMRVNKVLDNSGTWAATYADGSGVVCLEPAWLGILEVLLRTPDTARDCLEFVRKVAQRDALTPGLQSALIGALDSGESDLAHAVIQILNASQVAVRTEQPVLEHIARIGDPVLKKYAAIRLAQFTESEALLELFADPDAEIRHAVARSLRARRRVQKYTAYANGNSKSYGTYVERTLGDREYDALRALLGDEDPTVRDIALDAALYVHREIGDEPILQLIHDPDPDVRRTLASGCYRLPAPQAAAILAALARDRDEDVAGEIDDSLEHLTQAGDLSLFVDVLLRRFGDVPHPMSKTEARGFVDRFSTHEAANRRLVRAALDRQDDTLLRQLLDASTKQTYLSLDDASLAELLSRAYTLGVGTEFRVGGRIRDITELIGSARPEAMLRVLADVDAPSTLRFHAAQYAAREGEAFRRSFLTLLAESSWHADRGEILQYPRAAASRLPDAERNPFLLEVIANEALPDDVCIQMADRYVTTWPLGQEITLQILTRWLDDAERARDPLRKALEHLATLPGDFEPELLIAAARIPDVADVAVESMGQLRDPRYLEILGRCLSAEWINPAMHDRQEVQLNAAEALTGYFNDVALALLIEGLKTTDTGVWNACAKGIETIEEYQRRTREWNERTKPGRTPESAVEELAGMLEDEDPVVRGEAAKGLATLGAKEYLPVLIRMLKDEDEGVRTAVRASLDRLNAPPEAEGTLGKLVETDETTGKDGEK